MTDTQWHDLVGNFGIIGALLLALIAWVLYSRRPKTGAAVDHFEKLRDKIDELNTLVNSVAKDTRHDMRNALTGVSSEILQELKDLAKEMREALARIERR